MKKNLKGLLGLTIYYLLSIYEDLPLRIMNIDISHMSDASKSIYMIAYEVVIAGLLCLLYHRELERDFNKAKHNAKLYFHKYFKYWFIMIGAMLASNIICLLITHNIQSENQTAVIEYLQKMPIYTYLATVLFAPIIEELTFRQSIRELIPHKWAFIITSGLIFGLMHVISSTELINYIYIIPYSIPGFVFAYLLVDSDNLFVPMAMHCFHNGISVLIQIIAMLV